MKIYRNKVFAFVYNIYSLKGYKLYNVIKYLNKTTLRAQNIFKLNM